MSRSYATTRYNSSSGGANIATQQVTAVQVGSNVTIDLTQLTHIYTAILLVIRNGQILTPTTSWSITGSTLTILNASAGNAFLIQYTY